MQSNASAYFIILSEKLMKMTLAFKEKLRILTLRHFVYVFDIMWRKGKETQNMAAVNFISLTLLTVRSHNTLIKIFPDQFIYNN